MRKRHCSSSSSSMELLLPHDLLERILERLPAKSLLRFKCVSKKLKSTIESSYFQKRQMSHHSGEDDLQVLLLYMSCDEDVVVDPNIQVLEEGKSQVIAVKIPTVRDTTLVAQASCDGLVCVYGVYDSGLVANPTTGWSRSFPPSKFQQLIFELGEKFFKLAYPFPLLGFCKDILRDTYKLVFLYNSSELGLDNATTCEVFDFDSNTWRYVFPASQHRIIAHREPLYFDGSLHWFTEVEKTKVLSFHLHTETFQLMSHDVPFVDRVHPDDIAMCCLSNRFCVSRKKGLSQLIWFFDSPNNNKNKKSKSSWVKLYSIDLNATSSWFGMHALPLSVLALPSASGNKTNKLLLYDHLGYNERKQHLVLHDPQSNSYDLLFTAGAIGFPLYYFQSLISI